MIQNDKISSLNFNKKFFLKNTKKKLNTYSIICRLKITNSDIESKQNINNLVEIINKTLQKSETFSTGNIFYILFSLEEYYEFLEEFQKIIISIIETETLKFNHNTFLLKQKELIEKLNKNYITPQFLDKELMNQAIENKS